MAVEIKELIIRAVARQRPPDSKPEATPSINGEAHDQQAIIQACVKEVLRILERKKAK